jgi:hypothetical protein
VKRLARDSRSFRAIQVTSRRTTRPFITENGRRRYVRLRIPASGKPSRTPASAWQNYAPTKPYNALPRLQRLLSTSRSVQSVGTSMALNEAPLLVIQQFLAIRPQDHPALHLPGRRVDYESIPIQHPPHLTLPQSRRGSPAIPCVRVTFLVPCCFWAQGKPPT